MDHLVLEGLTFYGHHGVREEEKRLGQRFVVDLLLALDLQGAGQSDRLDQTVDYSHVYRLAREVVEGPSHNLIEAVAETLAERLLGQFPRLHAVTVRVRKPWAPIAGSQVGAVAVEISRSRHDAPS